MGIVDVQYRTVTCNNCGKTVTYEHPKGQQFAIEENPWLKTTRILSTADNRIFALCSDLCEIASIESGFHNIQEAPKVEIPTSGAQAQIAQAAAAAKRAEDATKAIKSGFDGARSTMLAFSR